MSSTSVEENTANEKRRIIRKEFEKNYPLGKYITIIDGIIIRIQVIMLDYTDKVNLLNLTTPFPNYVHCSHMWSM